MIAVQSRNVMVRPKSRRVFGHEWAGQEGTDERSPNSAEHLITGNPAIQCGWRPKRNVAENPAMSLLTLTLPSHRNMEATAT